MGFNADFHTLTGFEPLSWQKRLYDTFFARGEIPGAIDIPTGLGKTSVIALWLIARARGATLPRRLVYVVDRRAVVDQATDEAMKLRAALEGDANHFEEMGDSERADAKRASAAVKVALGIDANKSLPISTLRGAHVDNRDWLEDPAAPAIIVGTVDMIGSRLLFEGYGVSPKMRPYQAGFLGVDALVVLDEAHLVPPFEKLLEAIEAGADMFGPTSDTDRALVPPFRLLSLSATSAPRAGVRFQLEESDLEDKTVRKRLNAKKCLTLEDIGDRDPDQTLAEAAWALRDKGAKPARIIVFCNRRDKKEDASGPSAEGVRGEIEKLAAGDKKLGLAKVAIETELFVGARRVKEREDAAAWLEKRGFIGAKVPLEKPAFLIATSAGEVGVDLDADHMVCDLVAWERMVQRLGRVNRRGEGDASVTGFHKQLQPKKPEAPTAQEKSALVAFRAKDVIERLPKNAGGFDASPGAIRAFKQSASLHDLIAAATTPAPLRPALNRALVDAWSMTSLKLHTGRPDIAPWLRGWVEDDKPQTIVIWRTHLPVREGISDWPRTRVEEIEVEDFFESATPHGSEKLEAETYRVVEWLAGRAKALLKHGAKEAAAEPAEEGEEVDLGEIEAGNAGSEEPEIDEGAPKEKKWKRDDIGALALTSSGGFVKRYTMGELAQERDSKAKKGFEAALTGKVIVVDARFGGLNEGMLDPTSDKVANTADSNGDWSRAAAFRVRLAKTQDAITDEDWRFEHEFVPLRDNEGAALEFLVVEVLGLAARQEDARSISKPQELVQHQDWAKDKALRIAKGVGLSGEAAAALALAARLHDEGKRAACWQRAFKAPRDTVKFGLSGPLAKTRGPIDQAILGHYRHEFGSLPYVERDVEFGALPGDWRDLVLHLVAAHHGQARPMIETRGCEDGPPSLLEARAREIALRFARLQKRWGPWGLAWWEALLRAADAQASRENDAQAKNQAAT